MDSDEALARRAQRGDAAAFGQLVDRYQEKLLRFLLLRRVSRPDAEDALQDAFTNAWRYLHSYDSRWRFSTWLYRIAIRATARPQPPHAPLDNEPADTHSDPFAAAAADSDRDNLWQVARRELPPDAVAALWLHYVDELPQRDVAIALDRSLPWTKVTLMRARRTLKLALAREAGDHAESNAYG